MKTLYNYIFAFFMAFCVASCQDKDYEIAEPLLEPVNGNILMGTLDGNDYVWSWETVGNCQMVVNVYVEKTLEMSETVAGNEFRHKNIDTNIDYTYVFKLTDGTNLSSGTVKHYTRSGASKMTGLSLGQVDKTGGYDVAVSWSSNETASEIIFSATNGSGRIINEILAASATSYIIENVAYGEEWNVTITARNDQGTSLPVSSSLKIGKTAIGYLSVYPTPEKLIADGDDDEASAWMWLQEEYPTASFVYFGDIKSANDLEPYRVLFWMRDLENVTENEVFSMPEVVENATPSVRQWYADGGNLLLWSHATVYVGAIGRLDMEMLKNNDHAIGTGSGNFNGDVWNMAVSLNPAGKFSKDHSSHPIYRGLTVASNDRCKLIAFKGAGWTEDHNCLFFNIPASLTGLDPQDEACYNVLTQEYGIFPLGTWDSQIDWVSQLNVWEAQQGNTDFKGTVLCIGNGGCEFSMKNPDGTPDKSAHPTNNPHQDNILLLARNALEYLKTR